MHDHFTESLSDYLDGELDLDRRTALEEHLGVCAECSSTLAGLRRVVTEARALRPRAPSESMWAAIGRGISGAASESPSAPLATRRPLSPWLVAAAVLIAVLLGAGGSAWWITNLPESKSSGPRWLLLLHETAGAFEAPATHGNMDKIVARYAAWNRDHAQIGEKLADAGGVRLYPGGLRAELATGDAIGGLFIIEAADEARAIEVARTCPHLDYGGWIELRRIEDTRHAQNNMRSLGY